MPKQKRAYRVLRTFDVALRSNAVRAVTAGTILRGAPRAVIAKGNSLGALEKLTTERKEDG